MFRELMVLLGGGLLAEFAVLIFIGLIELSVLAAELLHPEEG